MGFLANLKAQKAYKKHSNGEYAEAKQLYEESIAEGMNQPKFMLSYSILLLREGEYQKAREILVKTQKMPGLAPDQRMQLFCNYACAVFRLGEIDKGISILEKQHLHNPTGLVYQTLGYLYVEKYDLAKKPDFSAVEEEAVPEAAEMQETDTADADETAAPECEPKVSSEEEWENGIAKAKAFLDEAVAYDEEDPICIDNLAQFFYRVLDDKTAAKPLFEQAHQLKDSQIDTLWFLSRYDLENNDTAAAVQKLEKALEGRFSPLNFGTKEGVRQELDRLKKQV